MLQKENNNAAKETNKNFETLAAEFSEQKKQLDEFWESMLSGKNNKTLFNTLNRYKKCIENES